MDLFLNCPPTSTRPLKYPTRLVGPGGTLWSPGGVILRPGGVWWGTLDLFLNCPPTFTREQFFNCARYKNMISTTDSVVYIVFFQTRGSYCKRSPILTLAIEKLASGGELKWREVSKFAIPVFFARGKLNFFQDVRKNSFTS